MGWGRAGKRKEGEEGDSDGLWLGWGDAGLGLVIGFFGLGF